MPNPDHIPVLKRVAASWNFFFFFNDTATTEIYTLSLHDALPISLLRVQAGRRVEHRHPVAVLLAVRSEEHTSELQSPYDLVCRHLLEKNKKKIKAFSGQENVLDKHDSENVSAQG